MNKYRTHNCSELTEKEIEQKVYLSGWLHRKRDHGNLLFIDLRDHYGVTQCVIENNNNNFSLLEKAKPETVIQIDENFYMRSKKSKALKHNKTILICSNYAWTIVNFRLPLIKSFKEKGYRIFVATEYDGYETQIAEYADIVQPLFISRKGVNPLIDIITILKFKLK